MPTITRRCPCDDKHRSAWALNEDRVNRFQVMLGVTA
jgi:hypothetical protein